TIERQELRLNRHVIPKPAKARRYNLIARLHSVIYHYNTSHSFGHSDRSCNRNAVTYYFIDIDNTLLFEGRCLRNYGNILENTRNTYASTVTVCQQAIRIRKCRSECNCTSRAVYLSCNRLGPARLFINLSLHRL